MPESERKKLKIDGHSIAFQSAFLATVYFEDAHTREVRHTIADYCEEFIQRWGSDLRWAMDPDTRFLEPFGRGKGWSPRSWIPWIGEEENFMVVYHDGDQAREAGALSLEAMGLGWRPTSQLGFLRVSFPVTWFSNPRASLRDAMLDLCRTFRPCSGYGGVGMIESRDLELSIAQEPNVVEMLRRFPGLEADYPGVHANWLAKGDGGIKGVNWLTVVGDRFLPKLGGADALAADLRRMDPRFVVHRFDGGVVIQAGPRYELGDTERDVWPELYIPLAKKLLPIRIKRHGPMHRPGPGLRLDTAARSEAWLRRFDNR
jgi:hypothetical protein